MNDAAVGQKRNKNGGIRKRCGCPPKAWTKCQHSWHFNFKWKGVHYRLGLDREAGRHLDSKSLALAEAERIRTAIRNGSFRSTTSTDAFAPAMTFAALANVWRDRRGSQLVRPRDNDYRLQKITAFPLGEGDSRITFGDKPLKKITTDDIERFRESRNREGLSPVTVNHDLKLLRKMLNWAVRMGYLERTPFKIGTETAISLEREIPRAVRFESDDDEQRLLDAADPHLRGVIIALLDTACRLGELLSLQWKTVNLERREMLIDGHKAKTRTARILPISNRLHSVLELRRHAPDGQLHGPEAYVFGNDLGEPVKSVRERWEKVREAAGMEHLQLRDLRHEAGSRFDEAGVPTNYVSKILGHTNLTTTSRYLNIHRRGLHLAMEKLEQHRSAKTVAQPLHNSASSSPAVVPTSSGDHSNKRLPS
jgi:integrase